MWQHNVNKDALKEYGPALVNTLFIPIICIDGCPASGKGTISKMLSKKFGYNYCNSGAMYRTFAYTGNEIGIDFDDINEETINSIIEHFNKQQISFNGDTVIYNGVNIWTTIKQESFGVFTSKLSSHPSVRKFINNEQIKCAKLPGLVCDGQNTSTEVFPNAKVKIYLDASIEERAKRRFKDDDKHGRSFEDIYNELASRDKRDKERAIFKALPAPDALYIDTTNLSIEEVYEKCLDECKSKGLVPLR